MTEPPNYDINIDEILGDQKARPIPIDKCVTGKVQARQSGTKVDKDDKLVGAIRRTSGILSPIIVKDLKNDAGEYEIIVGQRRTGAYHILKEEDPKYKNIKAYVIDRDLDENEIRIISFVENFGRDDMDHSDYVNVIEYFYVKFARILKHCAKALGISTDAVKKYLLEARLGDKIKECIKNKEFTIDTAMQALKGLGDDEESVDEDLWIATSRALKKVKPATRKKAVKKMITKGMTAEEAVKDAAYTTSMSLEITSETMTRLEEYTTEKHKETKEDAAVDAMEAELFRDQVEASS